MAAITRKTRIISGVAPERIPFDALMESQQPAILKGVASDWPLVRAGHTSAADAMAYLLSFDGGRQVTAYTGKPEIKGRFFYNDDVSAMNFDTSREPLAAILGRMAAHLDDPGAPSFYIGSTDLDIY